LKIAIISVPHTGTHFVFQMFGGEGVVKMGEPYDTKEHRIISNHTNFPAVFEEAEQAGYTIVTPMRHPLTTLRSWMTWQHTYLTDPEKIERLRERTRKDGDCSIQIALSYEDAIRAIDPKRVVMHFKSLIAMNDIYDINFFPCDSSNRQEFLDSFNKKYKQSLETQWKPVNSIGTHTQDIPFDLYKEMMELMDSEKEFFDKFKYS
jgi:hypothetical protein